MLDKELDKLRDKTLSFDVLYRIMPKLEERYDLSQSKKSFYKVIWQFTFHWWRIDHLDDNIENIDSYNICRYIWARLRESHLLDKSENRTNATRKRPETQKLLLQFSNYLK